MNKHIAEITSSFIGEGPLFDAAHERTITLQHAYENMEVGLYNESARLFYLYINENDPAPEPLNGLTVCMYEMEYYTKALELIDYTLTLFPNDPVSLSNKASLCWQMEDYEQAIHYYTLSIAMDPSLIDSRMNLINLYRENGDILLAYAESISLVNDYPESREIRELSQTILLDVALMLY